MDFSKHQKRMDIAKTVNDVVDHIELATHMQHGKNSRSVCSQGSSHTTDDVFGMESLPTIDDGTCSGATKF